MDSLIKSHNDYWNKTQIDNALMSGCSIIETDVIYHRSIMYNSHSWRPCACMMYGKLTDYLPFFRDYKGERHLYLYIEIKARTEKCVSILTQQLMEYNNPAVTYLISGIEGVRRNLAESVYWKLRDYMDIHFYPTWEIGKPIENLYLYRTLPWYKRINHW